MRVRILPDGLCYVEVCLERCPENGTILGSHLPGSRGCCEGQHRIAGGAKKVDKIAASDPGTLCSDWTISEDGTSARVGARAVDAAATLVQFSSQRWGGLDSIVVFLRREGARQRGIGAAQRSRDLKAAGKREVESTISKAKTNGNGPGWPKGIGEPLGKDLGKDAGLHNFTGPHLRPSTEVKDLPQTQWDVSALTTMTDKQKENFHPLTGRAASAASRLAKNSTALKTHFH